jgi:SAM-dependent methyltransferase
LRRFADLQFGSIWRDLAALLPKVEGTMADVGCGAQPFRDLLRPEVRYIAVDIDDPEKQFGYGSSVGGVPGHGLPDTRYFRGSVLPLADGEADSVLCTETLEHVLDTASFLSELNRALAPGGRLILTVPFAARWHFVPLDYWRYTPSGLEQLLTTAGFCEVRVYARGGALAVAGYKVLGLVMLLLAGHGHHGAAPVLSRLAGVCLLPLAALAALAGNLGLKFPGTAEDTLGYTVLARKDQG